MTKTLNDRKRGHQLMTAELRKSIPALYSQENVDDPTVVAKYFTPYSNWTWYVLEFDGDDLFFGLVDGFEAELGYFTLTELDSVDAFGGMPAVERDLYWSPRPLSQVRAAITSGQPC